MIRYARRLPPNPKVSILHNGLVRKVETYGTEDRFEFIIALCEHLIKHPEPDIVRIYDYNVVKAERGEWVVSYDMMRCGILEKDERWFVDVVGDATDFWSTEVWEKLEAGGCNSFREDLLSGRERLPELAKFLTKVVSEGRYLDLHSGNVMRDEEANYVLIDLEGFVRTPLKASYNDWIKR